MLEKECKFVYSLSWSMFLSIVIIIPWVNLVCTEVELHQIVDLNHSGGIGCVLMIHPRVEQCKSSYEKRVTDKVKAGYKETAQEYRQAMCCGFWSMRDCVAKAAREKCDERSARTIENMKIYSSENANVLAKKCDGFEYGSYKCSGTVSSLTAPAKNTLVAIFVFISLLFWLHY